MGYIVVVVLTFVLAMILIGRKHPDHLHNYHYEDDVEDMYDEEEQDVEKRIMSEFFDMYCEVITTHNDRTFIVWLETGERMCEVVDNHIAPLAKKNRFIVPQQRQYRPDQYKQ